MDFSSAWVLFIAVVLLAWAFDFLNGFHDAANAIATIVSTKVLTPTQAVVFGSLFEFAGALSGTAVASTIGKGIIESTQMSMDIILCALISAILWNLITWYKGLPSSSSHGLIGALVGATVFSSINGVGYVHWQKLVEKVVMPMVMYPVIGLSFGFLFMTVLTWLVYKQPVYRIHSVFGKLQLVSAAAMACAHGNNDAQKSMGIITLGLMTLTPAAHQSFHVPMWVMVSCAFFIAMGTLSGGWRIIRTLGSKMIKLQPVHGFAAETTAASVILTASHYGIPVSTTHLISSAIMGVGATRRLSAVKWTVVGNILMAWGLTIPITFAVSGLLTFCYQHLASMISHF